MRNHVIKVGTCVPSLKVGDVEYNTDSIIQIMQSHTDCSLLVFPELSITGYTCADLFQQDLLLEETEKGLDRIAKASASIKGMTAIVGLPLLVQDHLYNCAAYVSEGEVIAFVPKINIPNYSEFYEERWFTSGKDIDTEVFINGKKVPFCAHALIQDLMTGALIGTDICEDLWVPDKPSTHACLTGANIIVNLSASDELIGKQDYRRLMVEQQSASCYCAYLYVSAGMDESSTDLVFSGHSVIAENGKLLADSIFPQRPSVTTALIDLDTIRHNRMHQNTFGSETGWKVYDSHISPITSRQEISWKQLKEVLEKEKYAVAKNPFVPKDLKERGERCRQILEIQANGLATRVRSTGIHNCVIGISGGLDSTLALIVCYEAQKINPDIHIIGVTLPNKGNTTSLTYDNAVALMDALEIEKREVPIEQGVKDHLNAIGHGENYLGEGDTTYENAQARMRTYILMDEANMEDGLVIGTGDLSELALGWCTYNGDHMSMYGVNASVPKTLVQYIVEMYASICGRDDLKEILMSIVNTPISPELTPSKDGMIAQKTEEKIGKYDLNDFFLFHVLRYGRSPEKTLALASVAYADVEEEVIKDALKRFYERFFHQQFKRSCLPDGPKVGSVTLSPRGDWRMPSDASVALWKKSIENL